MALFPSIEFHRTITNVVFLSFDTTLATSVVAHSYDQRSGLACTSTTVNVTVGHKAGKATEMFG